ncbi:MAG: hypothetical protein NWE99_05745 [Candidatus Bathyarchaeota archaeon]|nr:hypothetical protein [Candidatus Bathyarchaeota archaeon]
MRLLKDKKGQIRTIEAFFASMLLLASLTLIPAAQNRPGGSFDMLSSTAQNILLSLDSNGHLAELISSGNWTELKSSIQSAVSPAMWFNLTVFNENMTSINNTPICSGSAVSDNIVSTDYVCAATSSNYAIYIVRLQLAMVD